MYCGSDFVGREFTEATGGDDCVVIDYGGNTNYKTPVDAKIHYEFMRQWYPTHKFDENGNGVFDDVPQDDNDNGDDDGQQDGNDGQQYDGEGGYTGGGHNANNLNSGAARRVSGKGVGGRDPGSAGLGQDTGVRLPARLQAIGKYVAQGGRVHGGKGGYQGSGAGLGQDVGGAAEKKISGVKKATDAQRFNIDPNAPNPDELPWWARTKVSTRTQASNAQASAVQQGVANNK